MNKNIERKLAAIMFTDIAGYTAQMSKNEDKAFALIKKKRELLLPLLKKHKGKLIKEIGDGTMTRYFKADDAIDCATSFQGQTDEQLNIRAGIHMGEVIIDKEDVFGDVVNVASRLESIAVPGSVLVSKETIDKLEMSNTLELVSLGMQSLKGVGKLIEVYAIKNKNLVVPNPKDYTENKINVHSDDEVPSIAIIPFENKGKEKDAFYAYGISADLISDISSSGLIRVASKKQIEDVGDLSQDNLAKKLNVRYMANGELWRMDDMFQLSVELYDTKYKQVIWSDRWQEKWDNLPTIKINLSDGLLKALDTTSKIEKKVETTNTKAYELYLRAKHIYDKRKNTDDTETARELLHQAIELDDNLIAAKIYLGDTYREIGCHDEAMEIYTLALKKAEKLSDTRWIGLVLISIGNLHWSKSNYEKALDYYNRALKIFEEIGDKLEMANIQANIGTINTHQGNYYKALDYLERSLKIQDKLGHKVAAGNSLLNIGSVHWYKGDYDKALDYYERSLKIFKDIGNKSGIGVLFCNIANVHRQKRNYDYDKSLEYYNKSLKICEEIDHKDAIGANLANIGTIYSNKKEYSKALDYYDRSLRIKEEISDKAGIGNTLSQIANAHKDTGDYYKALEYYDRSQKIQEETGHKYGMGYNLSNIGSVHYYTREYKIAAEYLEKSLSIQKEIELKEIELITTTYLYLTYKHLSKDYDQKRIHSLIKDTENIKFKVNFRLYELLDDTSYLETAYRQIQEEVSKMEGKLRVIFLNYPTPKAIVEEYNKVFK